MAAERTHMSTSYYYVRQPFTSVRLEEDLVYDRVTVFERSMNCGTLIVSRGIGSSVCWFFSEHDVDDSHAPMRTHYGGKDVGCVVTENVRGLDPRLLLISEYGKPMTVDEIRALAGHVRKDGTPGELFGYDKP